MTLLAMSGTSMLLIEMVASLLLFVWLTRRRGNRY